MLRLSSFRFLSTITNYSNGGCAREATAPWGWSCIHNIHFAPRGPFVSSACQLPQPLCRTVVSRGADGQSTLRAVDSSCQARLLEIWVTLSKNRLLPGRMASRSTALCEPAGAVPAAVGESAILGPMSCVLGEQ